MVPITNGIETNNIPERISLNDTNCFKILGLGTIFKYHGYKKILYGISECKGYVDNKIVKFHIVGESKEIDNLKVLATELGISDNVIFHGKKYKDELDYIFNEMDIAAGYLALHRRNADTDTTLKVVEYLVRGIPFFTSGIISNIL